MKKILLSSLVFSVVLSADSFELFLQKAVQNSPYLKASTLNIEIEKQERNKLLRYENPSLGLDYSRFDPDVGSDDDGYSVSISQPIRLWGVTKDKKVLSSLKIEGADIKQKREKAVFIRDISLAFTQYTQLNMLFNLSKDEQKIADKIYDIAHARFSAGTIAKKEMLQARSSKQMSAIETQSLELQELQAYYELLKFAGISEDIELSINHDFKVISTKNKNPDLLLLQNQKNNSLAQATLASHKVEWINLNANFEKEYEQDISSLGIALPLAVFDTKSQEKKIAKLKAKQAEHLIENEERNLILSLKRLEIEREKLLLLKAQNKNIIKTQEHLLNMFEEGYKISKSNLLELQDVKNRVIESKKRLIFITTKLNQNAINTNYMQGAYNE
jgi:cobalt-zinc-cadmium efflux system outer membrane protein